MFRESLHYAMLQRAVFTHPTEDAQNRHTIFPDSARGVRSGLSRAIRTLQAQGKTPHLSLEAPVPDREPGNLPGAPRVPPLTCFLLP